MESLKGKKVLITGGAKRIGRAIAIAFAEEGADVVITYRESRKEADVLRSELEEKGVRCWILKGNLEDTSKVSEMIDKAVDMTGGLDVLVNNAGVYPLSEFGSISMRDIEESFSVNVWAPLFLTKRFAGVVEKGCVINIIDAQIVRMAKGRFAYTLSKGALYFLTRLLAMELAPRIRVNAVAPGPILPPEGKDKEYMRRITRKIPLKKSGTPEDVAGAVVFLAKSDFITGEVIYVDGGYHLGY